MECWWCGVEPEELIELLSFGGASGFLPNWPAATDHVHAKRPPSPGDLQHAGHEALMRIIEALDDRPMSETLLLPSEQIR